MGHPRCLLLLVFLLFPGLAADFAAFTLLIALFVVLVVEAVVLRGERCAILGVADGAYGVDGEVEFPDVGRGDLQAVEEQAAALGVELVGGDGLQDLDECELDGLGVFDGREVETAIRSFASLRVTRRCRSSDWIRSAIDGLDVFRRGQRGEAAVRRAIGVAC